MSLTDWLQLPTADWAGTLVGLTLAIVSAGAAIYSAAVVPWAAELATATEATFDSNGQPRSTRTTEGARALAQLREVRRRDPARGVGLVALGIALPMTVIGVIAGLQIPNVGWLFTVVPVLIAAIVAILAAILPGQRERKAADAQIRTLTAKTP